MQQQSYLQQPLVDYRNVVFDNHRWHDFVHRPGDIFVCTPAKCGTTWMQTIVATLLFPDGNMAGSVAETAPWIEMRLAPIDEVLAVLDAQQHRRSVKSHTPADGIPWFETGSYIVVGRDGRDVFMSFRNHVRHMREDVIMGLVASAVDEGIELGEPPQTDDEHAYFSQWLAAGAPFDHIASFWPLRDEPNVCFVHYDDLTVDLDGQMRRVAAFLEIEIDEALWPDMVERCTFASMKSRPDEIAPFERIFEGGAESFLFKGTNGRWREVLTSDELEAYRRTVDTWLSPDAASWLAGRTETDQE